MQLFFTLILAHLFADFPLQSNALAQLKKCHLAGVLIHVAIYTAVTALLLDNRLQYWPLIAGLGLIHFLIDAAKMRFSRGNEGTFAFLLDQLFHLTSMIVATYLAHYFWTPAPQGILPTDWLLRALPAAFIPAAMVCCWIWTTSSGKPYLQQSSLLRWINERMLLMEQRFGLVVIGGVLWLLVRQEYWRWETLVWW